jgi:hypothetical protein
VSEAEADTRKRRVARVCGVTGTALAAGFFLLRDALPRGEPLRELADGSMWVILAIAIFLIMYPSFVSGLIEGAERVQRERRPGHVWTLIAIGVFLCALSVLGYLLFDRAAAELGGPAGSMRSISLPLLGIILIDWGWARPYWLFFDDHEQNDPEVPLTSAAS